MDVIQNEVFIFAVPNKYGSQALQIKEIITQFKYALHDRISNKQKNLVDNINQHQIFQWESAHLQCFIGQQSYTEWELQSACKSRILLKYIYPVIFKEYEVPKSSLNKDVQKI